MGTGIATPAETTAADKLRRDAQEIREARERYVDTVGAPGHPILQRDNLSSGDPVSLRVLPGGFEEAEGVNSIARSDEEIASRWPRADVVGVLNAETTRFQASIDEAERRILIKFDNQRGEGRGTSENHKIDLSVKYAGDPEDTAAEAKAWRIHNAALRQARDRISAAEDVENLHIDTGGPILEPTERAAKRATAAEPRPGVIERLKSAWDSRFRREPRAGGAADAPTPTPIRDEPRRPSQSEISEAIREAQEERRGLAADLMQRPGVSAEREAEKLLRAGDRREWLVSLIPEKIRDYFKINKADERERAVEAAYDRLVDRKADGLLAEREKALRTLRGVDPNTAPHLLTSKQYRAAETVTRTVAELRELRPLSKQDYRQAMAESGQRLVGAPVQSQAATEGVRPVSAAEEIREAVAPPVNSEAQRMQQNREKALAAIRQLNSGVKTDGYRTDAQKAMVDSITRQLNEGRDTVTLTTRYGTTDTAKASSTHAASIEKNQDIIDAVRNAGVPVDTGNALTTPAVAPLQKKSEALGEGLSVA